ncbi:HigA family addiction module antidote protein [Enterococcus cecorum]|uniref:HigA family addiction module antitoxin n=1 Tax=Lactobacillales TaxID=186826 RepID=UPI00064312D3|nr:HigA family addiction module antitoxin [Enterococcus cecorum]KLO69493.1 DNA-binding protein [Enterococcus cecorum]CAI3249948.1 HigA family addiction module antidote protein [Enterococcus cecorum]CAI3250105.1 HigA family addiction module antidote protein [Enterococcus cecorum]CAI3250251.1 HigA family addiction module antidote protein [Enterococcus cecorum]CAI3250303.1 HigA family addiction module antidote protein [Enterococcus cecorum]
MSKEVVYQELIAFHPGSYVEDIIDEMNITQAEFADRLGISAKTISKIVNGEENISKDIADKLSKVTGISIKTWLNLQTNYDLKVLEIKNKQNSDEKDVLDMIDFSYFKKHSFIENRTYSLVEKLIVLRNLLNIVSLSKLTNFNQAVSYRNTQEFTTKSIINSNVMLELATNIARNKSNIKYKRKNLENVLPLIREMSLQTPETFFPKLKECLLSCGIVLVALPKLKNANLNGATKKFKNGSVLLLITDRNKNSDIFWFSLVHELGHIYYEDFYSNYEDEELYQKKEDRANQFALEFFIPSNEYANFICNTKITEKNILGFANDNKIHPSIVVGRLQKDGIIKYNEFNHLKRQYTISLK